MSSSKIPRLELSGEPNKNNEYIIFPSKVSKREKKPVKKTRKHKKRKKSGSRYKKSIFNIF